VDGLSVWGSPEVITKEPKVAFVGTRHASPYGYRMTQRLVAGCCAAGVGIVSGLARGIDGMAHQTMVEVGGWGVGVLGCGIDVAYPPEHALLIQQVAERGCVVSEYEDEVKPRPWHFPVRNRLIAALSQAVIIVEAGIKSGTVHTAQIALDLGIPVGVVPGDIDRSSAAGTLQLLRAGAHPIASSEDICALIDVVPHVQDHASAPVSALVNALQQGVRTVSALAERFPERTISDILTELAQLELAGSVKLTGSTWHVIS